MQSTTAGEQIFDSLFVIGLASPDTDQDHRHIEKLKPTSGRLVLHVDPASAALVKLS